MEITAEKILRAESDYYETIMKIASVRRDALLNGSFIEKHKGFLNMSIFWLCVFGIVLILIDLLPFGYCKPDYLQDVILLIFFSFFLVFIKKRDSLSIKLWAKLNPYISDLKTDVTFRLARRLVPFEARYTFQGNSISYSRVKAGVSSINWSREVMGEYYLCNDYLITYKNNKLYPDLFILVEDSRELVRYFERLGIKRIEI